jgi:hypothetical protein
MQLALRFIASILLAGIMLGVSSADGGASSSELEILYRQEFISTFAPDLMILVRNQTDRRV